MWQKPERNCGKWEGRIGLTVAASGRYFSRVFAEGAMRFRYNSLTLQVACDFCSLDIPARAIVPRHFPLSSRNDDCDGQECMLIRERLTTALKEMDALAGILEGEVHDMENDR